MREMGNLGLNPFGKRRFPSFHYSSAARLLVFPSLRDGFSVSNIPLFSRCGGMRQGDQVSVNGIKFIRV
jgi:hypothetical protein